MSKSLGNLVFVRDLLGKWEPAAIRLAILANHYRSDWSWEESLLDVASARLALWRGQRRPPAAAPGLPVAPGRPAAPGLPVAAVPAGPAAVSTLAPGALHVLAEVRAALDDDLDTPRALAAIDSAAALGWVGPGPLGAAVALLGVEL
jgi:L-cysteine:1D-myo-inositol 2-amino-2-deoxy-alpha-D-glucopyranoside ligase